MRRTACLCLVLSLFLAAGCRKPAAPAAGDGGDPAAPAAGPEESLLDGWVRRLRTQEPRAQAEAVAAIVQIHQAGDDVVPALLAALKDRGTHGPGVWFPGEPNSTREAVVMTLLKLGPAGEAVVETGVVPALAEGLADADAAVREHSAYALALLGERAAPARAALAKLCGDPEAAVRRAGYRALRAAGVDAASAGELAGLLTHADPAVRSDAAEALDWLPIEATALPALIQALKDEDPFVRTSAADAIGALGPKAEGAVPELIALVRATDLEQLKKADAPYNRGPLVALRRIGGPAVPALVGLLKDENVVARYQAALALGGMGPGAKEALPELKALMGRERESLDVALEAAAAQVLVGGDPKEPVEFLAKHMRPDYLAALTRDPKAIAFARARTAWTLGRLGEAAAGAVPELVRALKAAEPEVREAAMEALRDLGPGAKAAVDVLAVKLSDEDLASRLSAAEILRGLGPHAERAIPELAKAVQNPEQDPKVRRLAAETLGSMGAAARPAVAALAESVRDRQTDRGLRAEIVRQLGEIGPAAKEAVPVLLEQLSGGDAVLRAAAADALGAIGVPEAAGAVPELVNRVQKDPYMQVRVAAIGALGRMGEAARPAVPVLEKLAGAEAPGERGLWAAAALARIEPGKAGEYLPLLRAALRVNAARPARSLREPLRALALFGEAGRPALSEVRETLRHADAEVRRQAVRTLAAIGGKGEETVPDLLVALKDADVAVRREAVRALGEMGPAAKPAAERLRELTRTDPPLREAALRALDKIAPAGE